MFRRPINLLAVCLVLAAPAIAVADGRLNANPAFDLSGPGLRLAVDGTGLRDDIPSRGGNEALAPPGRISMSLVGPVHRAFLYWGGREPGPPVPVILTDGQGLVVGEYIGRVADRYTARADVTDWARTQAPGLLELNVAPVADEQRIDGASLVVVWQDPSDPQVQRVELRDGARLVEANRGPGTIDTAAARFAFDPASITRRAEYVLLVAGATPEGADTIHVSGNDDVHGRLASTDGPSWDAVASEFVIPSGANASAIDISASLVAGGQLDTMNWMVAGARWPCTAEIGDRLWIDTNGNGVQDATEIGLSGVAVHLNRVSPSGSTLLRRELTGADGSYRFDGLGPGQYEIVIPDGAVPAGYVETERGVGKDETRDSDFTFGVAALTVPSETAEVIEVDGGYVPTQSGACCLADSICVELSPAECAVAGGVFQGSGVSCEDGTCNIPGACCLVDGSCATLSSSACADEGGTFMGHGASCRQADCGSVISLGACCLPDGTCSDLSSAQCQSLGGASGGVGTECSGIVCETGGACCFPSGACSILTATACQAVGGTPQGSDCAQASCPVDLACCLPDGSCDLRAADSCEAVGGTPSGAVTCAATVCTTQTPCCLPNGSCAMVTDAECALIGGIAKGRGTCAGIVCNNRAACCLPDGSCVFVTPSECAARGGENQGAGATCATVTCVVTGACCFSDGTCAERRAPDCVLAGGSYAGDGTACADVVCTASGACCFTDGTCTFVPAADCAAAGGMFQGDAVTCAAASCPVYGACCFTDGTCTFVPADDCAAAGGMFQGDAVTCAAAACPVYGACCFMDGTCTLAPAIDCAAAGGTGQGDGTECASVDCPVYGACCFTDGTCTFAAPADCVAAGGTSQGDGTDCASAECPVYGACCFMDGTCMAAPAADCAAVGGTSQGDGTDCAAVSCPVYGACCFTDGTCTFAPAADCAAAGGASQGDGTDCAAVSCPVYGACCFTDGTCTFVPAADCVAAGGTGQGDGTDCAAVSCPVYGACCFTDGTCVFVPMTDCVTAGGTSQGNGTTCATSSCPVYGACCFTDGTCTFVPASDCASAGGTSQGDGVPCAAANCPVYGACCFTDGTCTFVPAADCALAGGTSQGDGVTCDANLCPPFGACCFMDGACTFVPAADCIQAGGVFQGSGVDCLTAACEPIGACCFASGACQVLDASDCDASGGNFVGSSSDCEINNCPPPVVVDPPVRAGLDKASFVIFPKVELRWSGVAPYDLLQDTFLTLTNDHNGDVRVQFYFVNGDPPLAADPVTGERAHPGWNRVDNSITLTGNQPACWRVSDGSPAGLSPFTVLDPGTPPGRPDPDGGPDRVLRGFVVAWAVDQNGAEIRWNHLSGNGTILSYAPARAWEYNAMGHPVVADVPNGAAPDANPGEIRLDGEEYAQGFDRLLMDFQAVGSGFFGNGIQITSDLDVTLMPLDLDVRQETDGPATTKASYLVWNENEIQFSGMHRCLTCWDQTIGSLYTADMIGVPNHLDLGSIQTNHGYARIDGVASQLCDVDFDPANNDTFPFPPGPGDPIDPRDVVSRDAALTGVAARLLTVDMGQGGAMAAGVTLGGTGMQSATVRFDVPEAPQELTLPPMRPTRLELRHFIDRALDALGHGSGGR